MKKLMSTALIGTLVAVGTSCTVEVKEDTKDTMPVQTTQYVAPSSTDDDLYLGVVYDFYPDLRYTMSDSDLVDLGRTICDAIDEGMTFYELVEMSVTSNNDPGQIGYIAGAAIGVYCPWNAWFVSTTGM